MKSVVQIGYMGLGYRGMGMLKNCFSEMADVNIAAICDLVEDKMDKAAAMLAEKNLPAPKRYTDYKEMFQDPGLDAIVIMTGWKHRAQYAIAAMEAGKYVAIEVGCAYDISECYALVEAYERTGMPVMMLENCCYGRREMAALRMAEEGLFGQIVQCSGGYLHDLREENLLIHHGEEYDTQHYRMPEYMARNCEQYPTHELGPIAKLLKLNRGNRLLSLRSIASAARGLNEYTRTQIPENHPYYNAHVAQADIITTILECANGEQIVLTLDTTLPRAFYSRGFTVRGTKGMCQESAGSVCTYYLDGQPEVFNNEAEWFKDHDHPLHREYLSQTRGGHGGMDWLVVRAFVESVKRGIEPPIDTYDTALWMAIAPLSEASLAQSGAAVLVPDFTRGKWFSREDAPVWKYTLETVCEEPETPIVP